MGVPRRGCLTCRKRRVKCDIVQPICGRCTKASRDCAWEETNHRGLLFKHEDSYAAGQARRPGRRTGAANSPANIKNGLDAQLDVYAFGFYVRNFLFQPDDLPDFALDYTSFVLQQWSRSTPSSSLHLALYAVAHAVFGLEKGIQRALDAATVFYAESTAKLREETRDKDVVDSHLITARLLLGTYQSVMSDALQSETSGLFVPYYSPDECHCRKAVCLQHSGIDLLRSDGKDTTGDDPRRGRAVRRSVTRACIFHGVEVPDHISADSLFDQGGPMLDFGTILMDVARFRAQVAEYEPTSPSISSIEAESLRGLAMMALDLDRTIATWIHTVPKERILETLSDDSENCMLLVAYDSKSKRECKHLALAHILSIARAIRILLNSFHVEYISREQDTSSTTPSSSATTKACRETIDTIYEDFCADLQPFFNFSLPVRPGFDKIDPEKHLIMSEARIVPKVAAFLAWPLATIATTKFLDDSQRLRAEEYLRMVANSLHEGALSNLLPLAI